jgi:hypothetical protein
MTSQLYTPKSGLPDGIFSNQKNQILINFYRALQLKMLEYIFDIWSIL